MGDQITLYHRLSLAEPVPRMVHGYSSIVFLTDYICQMETIRFGCLQYVYIHEHLMSSYVDKQQ